MLKENKYLMYVIYSIIIVALFIVAAKIGLSISFVGKTVTLIWIPSGISFAMLMLLGKKYFPAVFIGAYLASFFTGAPIGFVIASAIGNTLEPLFSVYILNRISNVNNLFRRNKEIIKLLIIAVIVAPIISAIFGTTALVFNQMITNEMFSSTLAGWWGGNAIGVLLITPLFLSFKTKQNLNKKKALEYVLILFLLSGMLYLVYSGQIDKNISRPLAYTIFPFLMYGAYRFEFFYSFLLAFLSSIIAMIGTVNGFGPFYFENLTTSLLYLNSFISIVMLNTMMLSIAIGEKKEQEEEILKSKIVLEDLVKNRTAEIESVNTKLIERVKEIEKIDAELEESRALLQAAMDNSQAGIVMVDAPDGKIRYVNKSGMLIRGSENEELKNIDMTEYADKWNLYYMDGTKIGQNEDPLARAIIYGEKISEEIIMKRDNGENRYVLTNAAPIKNKNGEIVAGIVVFLDITIREQALLEAKAQKEKAEEANKAKTKFLSNMSHELRTPLNAILGFTEVLKAEELEKNRKEMLDIIEISGRNLMELINDILDIAKIDAGKMALFKEEINLNDLAIEIEKSLRQIFKKNSNEFILKNEIVSFNIVGDYIKLKQIIVNLLGNSAKFTKNGKVEMELSEKKIENEKVIINFKISDNGVGINKAKMKRIFEEFEQGEDAVTKQYGGTGLGLSIVKKLIDLMQGRINVSSEEGKGTIFEFEIPFEIAYKRQKESVITNSKSNNSMLDGLKILLADDSEINIKLLERILENNGAKLFVAFNGEEVLEKIKIDYPDIILMDVQMPIMNGLEATEKIRELEKKTGQKTKIIAISAYAMKSDIETAFKYGIDDYITKPVTKQKVFDIIEKMIRK